MRDRHTCVREHFETKLVRKIGFEPIHPEETGLQPAAALQLYRLRIICLVGLKGNDPFSTD